MKRIQLLALLALPAASALAVDINNFSAPDAWTRGDAGTTCYGWDIFEGGPALLNDTTPDLNPFAIAAGTTLTGSKDVSVGGYAKLILHSSLNLQTLSIGDGGNIGKAHEFNRDCVKGDFFRLKLTGGTALLSVSLVAPEGKIIRIGGMNARNPGGEKNDLHSTAEVMRFDPTTQQWQALPPLPEPRSSHDAVILGDTLYVGGGWKLAGDDANAVWQNTLPIAPRNPRPAAARRFPGW